jgi:putative tricarboxylic transport membrane protein
MATVTSLARGLVMRTADILAALFWLAIAVGVTASGWDLRVGNLSDPGSGFMIFWIGVAMVALCLAALAIALRQPLTAGLGSLWAGSRWWHVPYVAALLALYAALLSPLGFPLVTVLLLLVLFKTIEPQGWIAALVGATASTAIAYLVFARFLGTQLPTGTLWSG